MSGDQFKVMIVMLFAANWEDETVIEAGETIVIPRGSIFASQREIALEAGVGRQSVRSAIRLMEANPGDGSFLTQEPTRCKAVYTIVNYEKYQGGFDDPTQEPTRNPTQDPTQGGLLGTHAPYKEKEVKKVPSKSKEAQQVAHKWMDALVYYTKHVDDRRKHLPSWLEALDLLHRKDGHTWAEIQGLIDRILDDTGDGRWKGWAANCASPMKLRKRNRDGIKYWDAISEALTTTVRGRPSDNPDDWDVSDQEPL